MIVFGIQSVWVDNQINAVHKSMETSLYIHPAGDSEKAIWLMDYSVNNAHLIADSHRLIVSWKSYLALIEDFPLTAFPLNRVELAGNL